MKLGTEARRRGLVWFTFVFLISYSWKVPFAIGPWQRYSHPSLINQCFKNWIRPASWTVDRTLIWSDLTSELEVGLDRHWTAQNQDGSIPWLLLGHTFIHGPTFHGPIATYSQCGINVTIDLKEKSAFKHAWLVGLNKLSMVAPTCYLSICAQEL